MKSLIVAAIAIHVLAACADDAASIVKIGLYKNGLAVVTRELDAVLSAGLQREGDGHALHVR